MPSDAVPRRLAHGLDLLNFLLADVRDGLGPYLSIYLLLTHHWDQESIGFVMAFGGIGAIVAQGPAGALVDRSTAKRAVIIGGALTVTAGSLAMPKALTGIAGSVFAPALVAITLGLVGSRRFSRRIGRNESFNHAGNACAAAITGGLAYASGPVVVFWVLATMAAGTVVATLWIPGDAIDHDVARGMDRLPGESHQNPSRLTELLGNRRLMIFAVTVIAFHFANAAMLPLVGQRLARHNRDVGTERMAGCIVAAQVVMVPVAYVAGAKADSWGRKPIFLAGFAVLAVRGFLYTCSDNSYWLVSVQLLDGVGAGVFGALFPLVVQDVTHGSGRFNISLGTITAATGTGAAVSNLVAGSIVVAAGYNAAFAFLGALAAAGFMLYLIAMPEPAATKSGAQIAAAGGGHGMDDSSWRGDVTNNTVWFRTRQ
ncbi:MFS transporter [Mycobacterium sp. 1165178.9]|uniref:MFS transporter n=1 Tax=Mycobacterium sp. 1165178.9 TaxID=1834070 RepID=UPI0009F59DA3|nr:MFS transporter [Mycobacterium sp. 1165178.9]